MLGSLFRAAVNVATLPVAIVADVVTLGGELSEKGESYTVSKLEDVANNLDDVTR